MALHLYDDDGMYNQHRLPFDGTIDWSIAMRNISATDYSGVTAIEALNWDYKNLSVKEFLNEAFERVKRLEVLKTL